MSTASKFEDLIIWQNSRSLSKEIYQLTNNWHDLDLKSQLRRAVVSISSNIAEGYDRGTKTEFIRFLFIAKGSASEVKSQLYLAHDLMYANQNQLSQLQEKATVIIKQITVLIKKLRQSASH